MRKIACIPSGGVQCCATMQDGLLSTAEVASRLGKSVATINRWAADGFIIPAISFPGEKGARLFSPAEVDRVAAALADEESEASA